MARDYKSVARRKSSAAQAPGWMWLLIGLLPGLLIALLVYLGAQPARDGAQHAPVKPAATRAAPKAPQSAPPEAPAPAKPRFDFYTILPEMEVAVPEKEISGKTQQDAAQVEQPGTYILQAGSFRNFAEADRLKASLTLLGVEASIQTVTVNNKDTWHRVHIGPYKNLNELNAVRARLKQNNIEAVLLKIKT
ncbi:MAG: SPOR domain-containing protein [Pseudomonadota bacterium]